MSANLFKNIPERLQSTSLRACGLTEEAAVLFLCELIKQTKTSFFLELDSSVNSFSFYSQCFENKGECFVYYPTSLDQGYVPGFIPEEKRYQKEAVVSLVSKKPVVCVGTKDSFKERSVEQSVKERVFCVDFKINNKQTMENLVSTLGELDYKKEDFVKEAGCFSTRGDIVDVFPYHFKNPVRVSFDGERIEKISLFDPISQLVIQELNKLVFRDFPVSQVADKTTLIDEFGELPCFVLSFKSDGFFIYNKAQKPESRKAAYDANCLALYKKELLNEYIKKASLVYFVGRKKTFQGDLVTFKYKFIEGSIKTSFVLKKENKLIISENQFFSNSVRDSRWQPKTISGHTIAQGGVLSDIKKGDLVVHRDFGIGMFCGIIEKGESARLSEGIEIEYKNNSRVFVSSDQLFLIQRYIGTGRKPGLSALGSKKWSSEIKKAKRGIEDIAKEIVVLYSKKAEPRSFSFTKTNDLDNALSDSFSFVETPDQNKAIQDVYADMNKSTPMDRLICGDVGYGKTEVAIRAIFKSFLSDKLSVLLCPTTILADQHYITCKERLQKYGVRISLISRFKTKKEQLKIIQSLNKKTIDVLIGTHRILSKDVNLKNLGLLIIDEEHRFGVKHKEKIRSIKLNVDLLTMTATPIPRTLQQSLVGLKDLSIINTPPVSRKPIITTVKYFSWQTIIQIIDAELSRGGQVYFLNNDVRAIPAYVDKIKSFFPNSSTVGASGKMESRLLEKTVLGFFSGEIDILVCTTIIESGLDVTNANSIIVNNAQNFGLPQLYQIRGRVGRGTKQARCLLLVPEKPLEREAYRRLKTIEQNTALGAGYNVSMKDLEIRGAGSLFGYRQSGHISSIGFELYCDMLRNEINTNKSGRSSTQVKVKMSPVPRLEKTYISSQTQRLDYYYRIAKTLSLDEVYKIEAELKETFGHLTPETTSLLNLSKLKKLYSNTSVSSIWISKRESSFYMKTIDPYPSLESFFSSISAFSHRDLIKHRYENKQNNGLIVFLETKNQIPHMDVLFSFVNLFNPIT